jgi:S-DNA-T family DNA segregation ATPase FtsK/SpoIIIE
LIQASRKKAKVAPGLFRQALGGAILTGSLGLALYGILSLLSYHPDDPAWSHSGEGSVYNLGGRFGAWAADVGFYLFGYLAYLFPMSSAFAGWLTFYGLGNRRGLSLLRAITRSGGFLLILTAGSGLATLHYTGPDYLPLGVGGGLGDIICRHLLGTFSPQQVSFLLLAIFLTGVSLFVHLAWFTTLDATGRYIFTVLERVLRVGGYRRVLQEEKKLEEQPLEEAKNASPLRPSGPEV